jgi:hypothetical protein
MCGILGHRLSSRNRKPPNGKEEIAINNTPTALRPPPETYFQGATVIHLRNTSCARDTCDLSHSLPVAGFSDCSGCAYRVGAFTALQRRYGTTDMWRTFLVPGPVAGAFIWTPTLLLIWKWFTSVTLPFHPFCSFVTFRAMRSYYCWQAHCTT